MLMLGLNYPEKDYSPFSLRLWLKFDCSGLSLNFVVARRFMLVAFFSS